MINYEELKNKTWEEMTAEERAYVLIMKKIHALM